MSAARRHRQDAGQIAPDINLEALVGWCENDGLDAEISQKGCTSG
ncbi:hypothetical protein [Acetobacter ascendens]